MKKRNLFSKVVATGLVGVTLLSSVGCAGQNSGKDDTSASSSSKTASSSSTADSSSKGDKKYTFSLAMFNDGPRDEPIASLEYYKKLFPDLEFNEIYIEKASAEEKINLLISSGETPDVLQMINPDTLYAQGVLGGFTEKFFREHAPNISRMIDTVDPDAWEIAKYDGENMYSIPGWNTARTYPEVSVWNESWLDAVGEEVPKTLEDAERVFKKFAEEDPDGNGKKDTYGLSEQGFKPVYGAFGMMREMWLEDEDGNLVYGDVMPEAKEALATLHKWYKEGLIDPEFITKESEGGYWALSQPLNKGKIDFTNAGWYYHWTPENPDDPSNVVGSNVTEFKALNPDKELVFGYPFIGPDGKGGHKHEQPLVLRTHFSKEFTADKERFGRFLEFVDYVNGVGEDGDIEPVLTSGMGQKGEQWDFYTDAKGNLRTKSLLDDPAELNKLGYHGMHIYVEGGQPELEGLGEDVTWLKDLTKDYPESYVNKLYKTLESAGKYKADLDKLLDEGYISIITGEQPIDYFDEMVKLWYSNGGQEMTDEANEWYSTTK